VKFYTIIQSGTNLVTKALITGEPSELQRALSAAPRGERASWSCEVDLDGAVLSPIYWSIRDGKMPLARVMLRDVLAIRADRQQYYYGREELFRTHPNIFRVLSFEAPELLPLLLDGLMWQSRYVTKGARRVNYCVKELWGDPSSRTFKDAWNSPLGTLVELSDSDVLTHPVLDYAVRMKWRMFARRV